MTKRRKFNLTTKSKALMKKLKERFEALPMAIVESALMDQTKDYLTRGRQFSGLDSDVLNEIWVTAFKQLVAPLPKATPRCDLDDAWAELSLRGAELPLHLVPVEYEKVRKIISGLNPDAPFPELDRISEEFIRDLKKPKN